MSALAPAVTAFEAAFDWVAAQASGRIVPRGAGVDAAWDAAQVAVAEAEAALQVRHKRRTRARVPPSGPAN
jgi:hypothetical protein